MDKFNLWIDGKFTKQFRSLKAAVNAAIEADRFIPDRVITVSHDDSGLRFFQLPGLRIR